MASKFSLFTLHYSLFSPTFAVLSQEAGMVPGLRNNETIFCKGKILIKCQEKKEPINRIPAAENLYMVFVSV